MTDRYILDERGEPVPCEDPKRWARWYGVIHNRVVAQTAVGPFEVSTVFLGLDHRPVGLRGGPPILWETMIFGAPEDHELDGYQERYASREAALEGHARAVRAAELGRPS